MLFRSLRRAVTVAAMQQRLAARGMGAEDVTDLLKPIEMDTVQLQAGKENKLNGGAAFILAFTMVIFLYTTLIMYGITVMRSVQEEKSSRIVEVLLASVSARALMVGKIVGVGAVGLTQVLIWATAGMVFSTPTLMAVKGMGVDVSIPTAGLDRFPRLFPAGIPAQQRQLRGIGSGRELGAGGTAVPDDRDDAHLLFHRHDDVRHPPAQRTVVGGALHVSLHRAYPDVPAHRGANAAHVANRHLRRAAGGHDVWDDVAVRPHLPGRYPDVRQAAHSAGNHQVVEVRMKRNAHITIPA